MIAQILGLCQAPNFSRGIPERQMSVLIVEPMDLLVTLAVNRHKICQSFIPTETIVGAMVKIHRHLATQTDVTDLREFAGPVACSFSFPLSRGEVLAVSFLFR